jgi:hypothetical protein
MSNINIALASLKINTGSIRGNVQLSVAATVNPTGFFYNGTNGHFYRPISTGNSYTGARAAALTTTFKGQQGYLVTITSADEDAFIFNNVPQGNIWFALTDEVTEGRWVIDAGPEMGTVIKTSNGQTTGNIQGQYNNWAGGEPNNSGNEDYAVTKWNGSQWNDLPNYFFNPYVIEYGTWSNPDDATFTEFYTNSVTHTNGETLRAQFNFDFGSNVDETKFSATLLAQTNNQYSPTTNTSRVLNGLGRVDMTNDLDTVKINGGGTRATTTTGQVEWCVIYEYDATNQRYRIGIDSREVNGIVSNPSSITSLQLFDLWNGPVTFNSYDPSGWTEVYVNTASQFNFQGSSFASFIRAGNGVYGLRAEFTFFPIQSYKPHGVSLTTTNNMSSLYNSIVTVSDVFLAFKELSNGGIFGNQSGLEFTNGIQFMNADVDGNGIFDERDTYSLLQHLTGGETIGNGSNNLSDYMKLYQKSEYDAVTKTNWNSQSNLTGNQYNPINLSTSALLNNFNINVAWRGDVNLSHSAQQSVSGVSSNSIKSMSLMTNSVSTEVSAFVIGEISNDKVIVTISLDPLQQEVVGTQFQLNYDNSKLKFEKVDFVTRDNPMNYGTNRGSFISIGSLITNGNGSLDKSTEYRVSFTPIGDIKDILGLTSISTTDAVNKDGKQLKVKMN